MTTPQPGDELWVARDVSGHVTEAFRRGEGTGGAHTDITESVDSVTTSEDGFHVVGRNAGQTWHASCDRDAESSETHLRGIVRATGNGAWLTLWAHMCRERLDGNMTRYGLSRREREVAWAMFSDRSRKEMAHDLFVTDSTIRNHTTTIARKMGLEHGPAVHLRPLIMTKLIDIERIEP